MTNLKLKVEKDLGNTEFPVNRTIVAQNVWCDEEEDLLKKAKVIINKTLKLPEVVIVRVVRKSGWEHGQGLIKIEVRDASDVRKILKEKKLLRAAPAKELRRIFLRQSKKEEVLIMECNLDWLMYDIGVNVILSSGNYHPVILPGKMRPQEEAEVVDGVEEVDNRLPMVPTVGKGMVKATALVLQWE